MANSTHRRPPKHMSAMAEIPYGKESGSTIEFNRLEKLADRTTQREWGIHFINGPVITTGSIGCYNPITTDATERRQKRRKRLNEKRIASAAGRLPRNMHSLQCGHFEQDFIDALKDPAMAYTLLPQLHPREKFSIICVYVARKWEYRGPTDSGPVQHVDLVLADEKGNTIYVEIAHTQIDKHASTIQENGIYVISRFKIANLKNSYRPVHASYMIEITCFTRINVAKDPPSTFPKYIYNLIEFDDLYNLVGDQTYFLDALGVIIEVNQPEWRHLSNQPNPALTRNLIIQSIEQRRIPRLPTNTANLPGTSRDKTPPSTPYAIETGIKDAPLLEMDTPAVSSTRKRLFSDKSIKKKIKSELFSSETFLMFSEESEHMMENELNFKVEGYKNLKSILRTACEEAAPRLPNQSTITKANGMKKNNSKLLTMVRLLHQLHWKSLQTL
ncbi:hypothetical protein C2845_PM02G01820 [Panicum miliaceum]|uniref:Replication protein A 70 kDa DNA-binding subunit B/D first OB fold domain-containing protein n=1 Tax=Panicum miliaceum TaxID=4540 RepID=A0A3L6SE09_PANMI|nr:hypothetical protein C2845_PM02G01820 [Panicum miliaceum]